MGRTKKRTRKQAKQTDSIKLTIREVERQKDGRKWNTFLVQGWKEEGKWKRKQFKDRQEAERFVALKTVELENEGRSQRLMLCPLSQEQLDSATKAFEQLGKHYTMEECVGFFLNHHRAPNFTITMRDALRLYLDDREREGLRPRSLHSIKCLLLKFIETADNPFVHEIPEEAVRAFLRGLRKKDGASKATLRSWNTYRGILHKFFDWCAEKDMETQRPWTLQNPVAQIKPFSAKKVREQQPAIVATTGPEDVQRLLSVLMRWRRGIALRYFAYLFFSGLRPDELRRLSDRETELVNLKTGLITIPADISKTQENRDVQITENLRAWLKVAPGPIVPRNWNELFKKVRKHFKLSHDEARHSFISYHVALHRSIGEASLQAGNSESIVRRHYLNPRAREEGQAFFSLVPDVKRRRAVVDSKAAPKSQALLKAI